MGEDRLSRPFPAINSFKWLHIVVSYTATKLAYTTKFMGVISVIICISYLIAIITKCGLW